ncbi:hypothetical protein EON76_01880 [bacterium]|nr:MAG: hypothetical protein EON76_01880 [bacterium]
MEEILNGIEPFIANINRGIDTLQINRVYLTQMDHVCYRVETEARYSELKERLSHAAIFLSESVVNDRAITTFEFNEPLHIDGWEIPFLELPAPKDGSPYTEGLEHVEFVVRDGDLDAFQVAHPQLTDSFSRKGMSKKINPELGLKAAGISVKFHKLPLGEVVRLEKLDETTH